MDDVMTLIYKCLLHSEVGKWTMLDVVEYGAVTINDIKLAKLVSTTDLRIRMILWVNNSIGSVYHDIISSTNESSTHLDRGRMLHTHNNDAASNDVCSQSFLLV